MYNAVFIAPVMKHSVDAVSKRSKAHSFIIRAGSRIFCRGGVDPFWGGFGLQCGHFSVKMYAKTKELGPVGGVRRHAP